MVSGKMIQKGIQSAFGRILLMTATMLKHAPSYFAKNWSYSVYENQCTKIKIIHVDCAVQFS